MLGIVAHGRRNLTSRIVFQTIGSTGFHNGLIGNIGNRNFPKLTLRHKHVATEGTANGETTKLTIADFRYRDGNTFRGWWLVGKERRQGVLTYPDGKTLTGEFHGSRLINGEGHIRREDGGFYEGGVKNGLKHGKGRLVSQYEALEGEFRNNKIFNGEGALTTREGIKYEGVWAEGQFTGKRTCPAGYVLAGEFRDSAIYNGSGTIAYADGETFTGTWKAGKKHGPGVRIKADFMVVECYFKDNAATGWGKITYPDGNVYEGDLYQNQKHGDGTITNSDGSMLKGEFRDDRIYNGSGTLKLPYGAQVGTWVEGKREGQGKTIFNHGGVWEGEFKDNKMYNGQGVMHWASGNTYEGSWVDGKMDGKGRFTSTEGHIWQGVFKDGKMYTGESLMKGPTGLELYATWKGGFSYSDKYDASIEERMGRNKEEEEKLHQTLLALREGSFMGEGGYLDEVVTRVETEPSLAAPLEVTHLNPVETTALSVGDLSVAPTAPSLKNSEPEKQGKSPFSAEVEEKVPTTPVLIQATPAPAPAPALALAPVLATAAAVPRVVYYPDGRIGEFQPIYKDGATFEGGKITYPDGCTLEGEFKEGKIWNVHGVFKFRDGNVYEGTFKESKMHGQGKFTYPDGRSHEGEFKKGKLWSGTGVITLKDGNVYEGEVTKGKRHGQGKIIYPDGRLLEGEFRVGLFYAGKGCIYNKDGSVYEGSILYGRRHGAGSLSNADGPKWEGRWEDGVFVEGKVVQKDGSIQEGEWVNEKLVKGVISSEKGVISEGTFTADGVLLNGLQQFVCNEGTVRQLQYADGVEISRVDIPLEDAKNFFSPLVSAAPLVMNTKTDKDYQSVREKRQAKLERQKVLQEQTATGAKSLAESIPEPVAATFKTGPTVENTLPVETVETRVVHYPNGNTYSGDFQEGKMHGQGKLIYPDGRTLEGEFREDRLWNGTGVLTHKDGAVYEGEFKKRKKHGQGKLTHPDGRTSEGEFKEGKIWNGTGVLPLEGNIYEGQFIKGKLYGQGKLIYPDGRIQEGQWEAGVLVDNSNKQLVKEAKPKNNKKKQVPLVAGAVAEVVPPVSSVSLTPEAVTKYSIVRAERLAKMMKQRQLLAQEEAAVVVEKKTVRPEEPPAAEQELAPAALLEVQPERKIIQESATPETAMGISSSLPPAIKTTSKPNKPSKLSASSAANAPSKVPSTSESKKHVTFRTHTSYYPNGNVYVGELKNNKWHGQGKLTYPDGRTLEGKFKNGDLVSGVGVLILSNDDIYGGEFQQGKIWNGAGVYTHVKSGDVYEGEYLNGKKHGQGRWNFADGRTWQGEFKEGMLWNGTGVWHLRRGSVYEGEVREGKRHGQGKLSHADGTGKEGRWEVGELVEEKGPVSALPEIPASAIRLTAEAVTKYNILRAQRLVKLERQQALIQEAAAAAIAKAESEPTTVEVTEEQVATSPEVNPTSALSIRSADVNSIEPEDNPLSEAPSEVVTSAPVPAAPLTSAADQKYNSLRAERLAKIERQQLRAQEASQQPMSVPKALPEAELTRKEGTTWNGKGVLTLKDGSVYEGELSEGKRHGQGKLTYPDGRSLEGEFRNGFIVSGTGVLCLTNGNMYGGEFKKSKLWNGVAILSLLEGKVYEGEYREGKHHGDARVVYPDGRALEGAFPSDRLSSGSGVIRLNDGSVYDGELKEGQRHGQGKLILHNGGVWEGRWENDAFVQGTKVNAIGQVQEIE